MILWTRRESSAEPILLMPGESVLAEGTPHRLSYFNVMVACALVFATAIMAFYAAVAHIPITDATAWGYFLVALLFLFCISIALSEGTIRPYMSIFGTSLIAIATFIIALNATLIEVIYVAIYTGYSDIPIGPSFLGWTIPTALIVAPIVFAIVLAVIYKILSHLASSAAGAYRVPITISLILIFILYFVKILSFSLRFQEWFREMLFGILGIIMCVYGCLLLLLIYRYGGYKFMLTDKRIIVTRMFFWRDTREQPYNQIADTVVRESFLGRRHGFGTILPITLGSLATTASTSMPKYECVIFGARNPFLLKNIISAQCQAHASAPYLKEIAKSTDKLREIAEKSVTMPAMDIKTTQAVSKADISIPVVKAVPVQDRFTGETLCFICKQFLFDKNIDLIILTCSHCSKQFHKKCIESWVSEQGVCPSCRNPMAI